MTTIDIPRTQDFYDYMRERERIRLRKEAGAPPPWTKDPVMQETYLTNVKREHDRTTVQLRSIYEAHKIAPPVQHLLNCAIYRYFGRHEFAQAVGWQETFNPSHINAVVEERQAQGLPVYTGAYMVHATPGDRRPKHVQVGGFIGGVWRVRDELCRIATQTNSWERFARRLQQVEGFGAFLAKEVTLDTFFTPIWPKPPRDLNTWTGIGPGARRGVARV